MNEFSVRRFCLRILASLIVVFVLASLRLYLQLSNFRFQSVWGWLSPDAKITLCDNDIINTTQIVSVYKADNAAQMKYLGVASSITILSLPTRLDRRRDMDTLRLLLSVPESEWKYRDAVASTDKRTRSVLEWVQYVRSTLVDVEAPNSRFSWPEDIDKLVKSDATLDLWDTYSWLSPFQMDLRSVNPPRIPCMTKDFALPFYGNRTTLPPHKTLTPARVACWYSHIEAIQRIANSPFEHDETAIILEDDVDMELDIMEQLGLLWVNLPPYWDIVFLGHCWSNESYHLPLSLNRHALHNLHPSRRPKCTHAYALSRQGARRILLHLRYPPFAFSRAIDQAFAWLVESGRIKAFSIVPSLVVQRKVVKSDIFARNGSSWKEKLRKGVLESFLREVYD